MTRKMHEGKVAASPSDPEQTMKLERETDGKGISDGRLSRLLFEFTRQYLTIYIHVAHDLLFRPLLRPGPDLQPSVAEY